MSNRTITQGLQWISQRLETAGIEDARRESLILLAAALGVDRAFVMAHPEQSLGDRAWKRLTRWTYRRTHREPLAYILGSRWFYGLLFHVTPDVLIPRPETELLIEVFLGWIKAFGRETTSQSPDAPAPKSRHPTTHTHAFPPLTSHHSPVLVDVGTGSGCIAIACLKNAPRWRGIGIDRSFRALQIARRNRNRHGLRECLDLLCGDWLSGLKSSSVQAVLSNPPYVSQASFEDLPPEIHHWEPSQALVYGDGSGLEPYRILLPEARRVLQPGGLLAVEIGSGQADDVIQLFHQSGWPQVQVEPDLAGIARVIWSVH